MNLQIAARAAQRFPIRRPISGPSRCSPIHHAALILLLTAAMLPGQAPAQQRAALDRAALNRALPDAPEPPVNAQATGPRTTGPQTLEAQAQGALSGTILDANGGVVHGAAVTVESETHAKRTAISDDNGFFRLPALAAGVYAVSITAEGFGRWQQSAVPMRAGQDLDLPHIVLPIASATTDMQVVYSSHEVARQQIKAEEQQRLLGVVPNFYSSYVWEAEPLAPGQKFQLAGRAIVDPAAFVGAGLAAGVEQWRNTYPGFGQGAAGYGSRYGAAFGTGAVAVFLGRGLLPVLFHQDPRYFYKGTGTDTERAKYAVTRAFIQRGDNGRWQPAYSSLLGNFASGAISNEFLTSRDRNAGSTTIANGFLGVGFDMADSLLREFVWKSITTGPAAHRKP